MADREIINQAEIDAAKRAREEQILRQQAASERISQLSERGSYETAQAISSLASTGLSRLEKLAKKATGDVQQELLGGIARTAATGTGIQTSYIQPYESAMGTLSEPAIKIPAPKYKDKKGSSDTQSAYDLLFEEFSRYGLEALIEPLKKFIEEGISPAELTLRLRQTDAYKKRFAANEQRIKKGLRALSEAEYIAVEDQYQNVMRRYGLPESYYQRGELGRQEGFEKFIAGDVSSTELEDRIATAQTRVINAAPEISATLRTYYPDITNGDILAYVLDPEKAITDIKRKVTAAEIGGAAAMAGLSAGVMRAEELARYGVTGEQARQGFQTVADVAPRGGTLAEIYKQSPYTQATAEQEVFGLAGATEAAKQRKKLTQLEQASFSGSAGTTGGALARERAGSF